VKAGVNKQQAMVYKQPDYVKTVRATAKKLSKM